MATSITLGYKNTPDGVSLGTGGLDAVSVVLTVGFRRLGFHWSGKKHQTQRKISISFILKYM